MLMILCGLLNLSAQIVLHDATNVTQTKATLSADFPNINAEHGFQYKKGSLPSIDDFSKVALSPNSDPIQLSTSYTSGWVSRPLKGWIENNTSIPVGKSSSVSTVIEFTEDSEISFEWSIDSEENVGFLNFLVDDVIIKSISGLIDFTKTTCMIPKGQHTLTWQYIKQKETNIGLDLAKLKNITLINTTPGEWITEYTTSNDVFLENLFPNSDYIFRAFDNNLTTSIFTFKTYPVIIDNFSLSDVSQTKANFSYNVIHGEINCNNSYQIVKGSVPIDPLVLALLGDSPTTLNPVFSGKYWSVLYGENGVYCGEELNIAQSCSGSVLIRFTTSKPTTITFDWAAEAYEYSLLSFNLYVDGKYHSEVEAKSPGYKEWKHKEITLSPGSHTIKWSTKAISNGGRWNNMVGYIKNLNLNIDDTIGVELLKNTNSSFNISNLIPNTVYSTQFKTQFSVQDSILTEKSQWLSFKTLDVTAEPPQIKNITQSTITSDLNYIEGDANIITKGLQYKNKSATSWSTIDYTSGNHEFLTVSRLRPYTTYNLRSFIQAEGCDTTYSDIITVTTLQVIAHKPEIIKISQHQATLLGNITSGDANIYQRGMQFKTILSSSWDNIEDTGNDSIFTLIRRNLEMGVTYAARTYVQPAGDDVIYSDTLVFSTLDSYFLNCNSDAHTQTSVTLEASLADTDDGASIDYGFEYYITSDGFSENIPSEAIDVPAEPNNNKINAKLTGLTPSMGICWRTYASVNGEKFYCTGSKNSKWDFVSTDKATITVKNKKITQTSISLELDATQEGDAIVSQIEYALANSVQDTQDYSICGNTLTLNNLIPNHQYNIRFRGLVNGQYCPLLKDISWDYSWFEYNTLPVDVDVSFSGITQTKAKMEISFESGDAEISDISYRLNYGDIIPYTEEQNLTNLIPGISYTITVFAKVNGVESSWSENSSNDAFKFTTKSVSTNMSISEIYQTAAKISWTSNVGDATFICSGLEYSNENIKSESESEEQTITGLIPNRSYSCRSFVETVEGGRIYSTWQSFTTKAISTTTLPVSNISNRSATMNGTIECDDMSSAEFGFQWKQMEGWLTDPAFTKGHKLDDGSISVALVNGMLEPNTDYQYRTAVRYHNEIYTSNDWKTFRTESEFIYYPPTVYTVFRTDRENNALILCGYYIAGSETITSQGYEYWQVNQQSYGAYAPQNTVIITTDESMQHTFLSGELASGNYAVRAFVKTETGNVLYGATLGFNVSENGYSSIDTIDSDDVIVFTEGSTLKVINGINLSCYIYNLKGLLIAQKYNMSEYEEFHLDKNAIYIVKLSNGKVMKLCF